MKYSKEIEQLSNDIVSEVEIENYTTQDVINSLLIFKSVLIPVVIENFKKCGITSKEASTAMNEFGEQMKTSIEELIGSPLEANIEYSELADEVID